MHPFNCLDVTIFFINFYYDQCEETKNEHAIDDEMKNITWTAQGHHKF